MRQRSIGSTADRGKSLCIAATRAISNSAETSARVVEDDFARFKEAAKAALFRQSLKGEAGKPAALKSAAASGYSAAA